MTIGNFFFSNTGAAYEIEQSLRFYSSDSYTFRRTPSSNSTSQKKFTVSVWSKRAILASGTTQSTGRQGIFYTGLANGSGNLFGLEWNDDSLACIFNGAGTIWPKTVAKFRDPSAWYHIVVAVDTAQATTTDRFKLYVNGVEQTVTGTLPTLDFLVTNGTTSIHSLDGAGTRSNQYLAEVYYINDQQLTPSDFGETNNDGVWIPKKYTGTFTGTNSLYLKFDPSATNGIGHDHSGNGNNFTASGFTTSGTGTDVMSDTPTTNWCTLNATVQNTANGKATLSEGNLVCSVPRLCAIDSTFGVTSGKYYWEVKPTDLANSPYGPGIFATGYGTTHGDTQYLILTSTGALYTPGDSDNKSSGWGPTYNGSTDVIGLALDMDNHTLGFNKNGGSFTTYDFSAYITSYKMADVTPCWKSGGNLGTSGATFNFGQRAFEYTAPTGYSALNTSNLPAPTVKDGSDYFNTVLYTGNGATTQTITGVGFNPDFTWIKNRGVGRAHNVYDVVRGDGKRLKTNLTEAESDVGTDFSFQTDGFFVGNRTETNENNVAIVSWNWLAGGSGSSNTAGNITSTVSANPTAGFSIVAYQSSTTTKPLNVGHGLGVKPSFILTKNRDVAASWGGYHSALGATKGIFINSTSATITSTDYWNNTEPTSTVFTVFDSNNTHSYGTTNNFIAYCFAEVEGYSKFGSYEGNGSSDGPFVYCGFKPRYVFYKRTDASASWFVYDTSRSPYNYANQEILIDSSSAEFTDQGVDFLSNGFKIRAPGNYLDRNASGGNYIFAAFAENPFGGSGVSPATAR